MDGIGFVWILKVYVFLALITPFVVNFSKKITFEYYYLIVFLAYLFYEGAIYLAIDLPDSFYTKALNEVVFVLIAYSILYCYGFKLSQISDKSLIRITSVSLFVFSSLAIFKYFDVGHFVQTQGFKYPPSLYYLAYAFFCINLVYIFLKGIKIQGAFRTQVIWLSSNSLWIYLWHIMAYYIWKFVFPFPSEDSLMFVMKFLFLISFGMVLTAVQNRIVLLLLKVLPIPNTYNYKLRLLLTAN